MRFLSVCSGIEAASVAWEPLGWKAVGFSEIEPFPCAVLAHRFPNIPNYGSLTEYASWPIAPGSIDLLVGGTPCQSFSVAGLRKGMADPRGNLALVFLGLADRVKPRWIVWENVPGVLSSNGGRDFGSFLGALEQLGYGWAYRVLDAQHFGVPQRRRRVFVVACLGAGGWESAAKVLFEPESLSGNTAKGRKKGQGVASDAQGGAGASGCWWDGGQVSQTLDAVLAKGQTMPEKNRFPAVLQPFRKSKRAASTTDDESWVEAGEANTLNNFDLGDTRTTHAVIQPIAFSAKDYGGDATVGISPTLRSQNSVEGNQNSSWSIAITFQPGNFDLGDTRTTHAVVEPGQVIPTLTNKMQGQSGWAPYNETSHILPVLCRVDVASIGDTRTTDAVVSPTITTCKGSRGGSSSEAIDEITAIHLAQASVAPHIVQASELRLRGQITPQDTCPTLLAQTKSGDNDPLAVHAITFQPGNLRREAGADPSTTTTTTTTTLKASAGDQMPHVAYCAEVTGTLTVGHNSCAGHQHRMGDNSFLIGDQTPHVACFYAGQGAKAGSIAYNENVSPTLKSSDSGTNRTPTAMLGMAVRRLTPTECMRLQGFPDDWARIPWKGKPADQCPDGPQYKAAGNSMAVPVMRWIGSRIAAVEQLSTQPTK